MKVILFITDSKRQNNLKKASPVAAYLSQNNSFNYIEMLWNEASSSYYGFFRGRVGAIGQTLSRILDNLVENYRMNLSAVHMIGYSAGAHIAGEAGRYVTKGVIGRITGNLRSSKSH